MDHIASRAQQSDIQQAQMLQERLLRMSYAEVNAYFTEHLRTHGTNVEQNKADPQGDGDQSRINHQFYRDMFATGGDINHLADLGLGPLSNFAKHCISGAVEQVQQKLESLTVGKDPNQSAATPELIRLLETRETAMRLSPLLMVVSMGKNLVQDNNSALERRHERVAELLLEYGARSDARDVCGKTVCHYGMGGMATNMTMNVVNVCIRAHASSHLFGKQVELHSLKTASKNGLQGWCKGYVASTGRRAVYLIQEKTTVGIKPENLKLVDEDETTTTPTKLCDIPDRLGAVCLLEVIQADRTDVAEHLLHEHHANLDIQDCDGVSPRNLSVKTAIMSSVAAMVNKAAGKETRQEMKKTNRTCANCGKVEKATEDMTRRFMCCGACKQVIYCGSKCQKLHWNTGGHKKACKKLAAKNSLAIVLDKPQGDMFFSTMSILPKSRGSATAPQKEGEGYKKPSSVGFGEKFDVKVQGGGPVMPLMVYDKTKECNFVVNPGSSGFEELLKVIQAEPTWQGRKTFVAASFDAEGNCTVYPGMTNIHSW